MSVKLAKYDDTDWIWLNNFTKYRKFNGIVYLHISSYNALVLPANQYVVLGTLPYGYRPDTITHFTIHCMSQNMNNQSCIIDITGEVKILVAAPTNYFGGTISFIARI